MRKLIISPIPGTDTINWQTKAGYLQCTVEQEPSGTDGAEEQSNSMCKGTVSTKEQGYLPFAW